MPDNKKHHYVPRFYLKRFSTNGRSIGLYNFANKQIVPAASLRNQCYEDYFYGKDKLIESTLGDVEHEVSKLFLMIDEIDLLPPPSVPEYLTMILYILIQYSRTQYSADVLNDIHDKMVKQAFGEKLKANVGELNIDGITIGLDDIKISLKDAANISLGMTVQGFPLLFDMGYKLLLNRTQADFITCDNPVVMCNPFLSFRTFISNTGLPTKGLQIFFPIAPDKIIVLFDMVVYRFGNDRKIVIEVENINDVHNINALQACSAYENIYFREDNFETKALHRKAKPYRRQRKSTIQVFPEEDNEKRRSELIVSNREDVRFNPNLSFMGIRKSAKRWLTTFRKTTPQPAMLVRDRKLYDAHQEFISAVKDGKYPASDFYKFIEDKG